MKKRLLLQTALMLLVTCGWAQGPNDSGTYYQNADGKSGAALKTALFNIIKLPAQAPISYDGLWDAYRTTDKRADGYVRDWYSCTTNYKFGKKSEGGDQAGNYSKEGDAYNREHSIPKSWFSEGKPMYSDIVHVVPTDGYVNNRRSNYPFGEVSNVTYQSNQGYCKLGSCKTEGYNSTVFEPNDAIKGDLARIYFYMATCYENKCATWTSGEGSSVFSNENQGLKNWVVNMMMAWSKLDPVDEVEIARNNAVKQLQGNRNPFVDYPGLEDYIWGDKKDVAFSYDNYAGGEQNYVARPVITPDAGTYYESVQVSISCATAGASIYYTLNGEDASEQSLLYSEPFTISELGTYTVKAIAVLDGERSAQAEATYTITEQGGQGGGGGEETPADCELALNDAFFGTSFGGVISNYDDDLVGTQDGVKVIYAKSEGSNRYCNDNHIRLYQGNKLTVKVEKGTLTEIEVVNKNTDKQLEASTGTVNGYTWTGDAAEVVFNVNSGSKNLQVAGLKIKVNVPQDPDPAGIDVVQTNTRLDGQRVIYDLSGRRVVNPTRGIYIVDGRKVVIK